MSSHFVPGPTYDGWLPGLDSLCYGGDYNPEHWSEEVWHEDVTLMREAGVNLVSVGMWNWVLLEPREGEFDFSYLDRLLDLLNENGVKVALGTPTAVPPAWFFRAYPDSRVVNSTGTVMAPGSRGMAAPTSPDYRRLAKRIATKLAERYANHPAVALWHIHNEYGAPVNWDFSVHAQRAFPKWLATKYGTLDALNHAWGTTFWGQVYMEWDEICLPSATPTVVNPAQKLDFARFCDAMLRECYVMERDAIREFSDLPATTNFMAIACPGTDLFAWGKEVDIVSNDHYLWAADPRNYIGLAMAADLTRSVAGGKPWMLLEHSTSAVNWQERNVAKQPGEELRNAASHLGRGADAIMFFQWRASLSGAEKFHSAMVPHAGTDSRVWREVVELGKTLTALEPMRGSRTEAKVALLWDQESLWAQGTQWHPTVDAQGLERMQTFYERLWRDGITTDFAHPGQDLTKYKLVIAPASYLLTKESAANLTEYVRGGGTLLVSYFSGIVDEHDRIHAGGFMSPLREVLGVWIEEFLPLRAGDTLRILDLERPEPKAATSRPADFVLTGTVWADHLRLDGAQVQATYADGPLPGGAAITRNELGEGKGWYLSTQLCVDDLAPLMERVYVDSGLWTSGLPDGVEMIRRIADDALYTIAINHTDMPFSMMVADGHVDLLDNTPVGAGLLIPAKGVRMVRKPLTD
ncbi:MAG: beta-galactosidase [Promicromonosporaceae bacterium]|nr:beta-galactosidase [Promicromonosporaceae bacterium]